METTHDAGPRVICSRWNTTAQSALVSWNHPWHSSAVGDFECLGIGLWIRQSPHSLSAAARVFEFMRMLFSCARGAHYFSCQPERSGRSKAISLASLASQTLSPELRKQTDILNVKPCL